MVFDSLGNFFNAMSDFLFGPLLNLPPFLGLAIITFVIMLITVLIYKKFTDQEVLKSLKEETKQLQKEMKEFKDNPAKVMELQKKSFEKAGEQFKHSLKPLLITTIPILIIFGWLNSNMAYYPITPDNEFSTSIIFAGTADGEATLSASEGIEVISDKTQPINDTTVGWLFKRKVGEASWKLKGTEGNHQLSYEFKDKTYVKDVLITNSKKYKEPQKIINDGTVSSIKLSNEPIRIFGLSWFWAYFIFAMIFNGLLRKLFNVH